MLTEAVLEGGAGARAPPFFFFLQLLVFLCDQFEELCILFIEVKLIINSLIIHL